MSCVIGRPMLLERHLDDIAELHDADPHTLVFGSCP